jgi:hypothetical protein
MTTPRSHATIYRRGDALIVVGEQELDDGMRVSGPPFIRLSSPAAAEIGVAVAQALGENRTGVVMADEEIHDRSWAPVLEAAGVASNAEFHRGTAAADVSASGNRIEVVASENLGSDRGFEAFGSPVVLHDPTPEELGEAVVQKLAVAATPP